MTENWDQIITKPIPRTQKKALKQPSIRNLNCICDDKLHVVIYNAL